MIKLYRKMSKETTTIKLELDESIINKIDNITYILLVIITFIITIINLIRQEINKNRTDLSLKRLEERDIIIRNNDI